MIDSSSLPQKSHGESVSYFCYTAIIPDEIINIHRLRLVNAAILARVTLTKFLARNSMAQPFPTVPQVSLNSGHLCLDRHCGVSNCERDAPGAFINHLVGLGINSTLVGPGLSSEPSYYSIYPFNISHPVYQILQTG